MNINKSVLMLITLVVMSVSSVAFAQGQLPVNDSEKEKSVSSDIIGEVRIVSMRSRDKDVQGNLLMKQVYLEKPISDGVSVFFFGYHDKEFHSGSVGLAKQVEDWQFGFGAGTAKYEKLSRFVVNPWLYYHKDTDSAVLSCEHYSKERDEPWFCKGYVERKFGDFLAGAYGETGSGTGPMVGYYLMDNVKLWASVPVVNKPRDGSGFNTFVGLTVKF